MMIATRRNAGWRSKETFSYNITFSLCFVSFQVTTYIYHFYIIIIVLIYPSSHIPFFLVCNNNNHTIMLMIIREYLEIFTHRHRLPPSHDFFCMKTLAKYYILLLYFHYIQSNLSECVLRLCLVHAWNVLKFIIKMNKFNLECTRRKCIVICIRIPSKEAETWTWNQKS